MSDVAYLDSSALAKLVVEESESGVLRRALAGWPERASSELAHVELIRLARRRGGDRPRVADAVLARLALVPIDAPVLTVAATLDPAELRSLDAIHLATAVSLGADLGVLVTYDRRMSEAAEAAGIEVLAPA